MPKAIPLLTRRRIPILAALFVMMSCVYMLTYSGRIESGDSFYLFDATSSLVDYGDFLLDLSAGTRPPQEFSPHPTTYPLQTVDAEPLQMVLAAPLYWLGDHLTGVGLAHAVWLFNIAVCALVCVVLYLYAIALGFGDLPALVAALMLGLGTIFWPYSKSFFREPLAALMLLTAAFSAERLRATGYRSRWALLGLVLTVIGTLLAKATTIMAFPALVLIALPQQRDARRRHILIGLMVAAALIGAVFVGLAIFGDQLGVGQRYNPLGRFVAGSQQFLPVALHSYLLSIGGSIWGTSPVTLLALPGLWMLIRRRRWRYVAVTLYVVLAFALCYALLSGSFWFGGLSWPPRFLIPAVPFLIVAALPAINRLTRRPYAWGWIVAAVVLLAYGIWIQFTAVSLWWGAYTDGLPPESGKVLEWGGGLNSVQWLRWIVIPRLWATNAFDFAWTRMSAPQWPWTFGALALLSAGLLLGWLRIGRRMGRVVRGLTAALPLLLVVAIYVGLRAVYVDGYYFPDRDGLFDVVPTIDAVTQPGDVVLLSNREYERFFLQYGKVHNARVITLPPQYGDRPSEEQPAQITADDPDLLLSMFTMPFIQSLAQTRDRIFVLENRGPAFSWAVRPIERFMAVHYYPIRVIETGPAVRLIEYSTVAAPDPYAFRFPDISVDVLYGGALRLVGYTLPQGTTYAPGDALPISFYWRADKPLAADYRVAWFLRTSDGGAAAQGTDSRPGGDFANTSTWDVGVPSWDNRALRLPADLAPGTYQLWVKVYAFDASSQPQDAAATGANAQQDVLGVLPTTIEVK